LEKLQFAKDSQRDQRAGIADDAAHAQAPVRYYRLITN
jgi:hypothetical protein